jgi:medium-chain acyl-[acyl-carrier-protein] hydrolase
MVLSWDPSLGRHAGHGDRSPGVAPLFCVPSAGNGELQFERWPDVVGAWRPCPLRPPTYAAFSGFAAHPGFPDQAADIVSALADVLVGRFALFGHGGAALLAYEMAVELERRGEEAPSALIVSGCPAPQHARAGHENTADETDDGMTERVLAAVLATHGNPLPAVVAAGVRALRAEAAALHAYDVPAPAKLRTPITVVRWSEQGHAAAEYEDWAACGDAELVTLPGAELRYATDPADLLDLIGSRAAG